MKKVILTLIVCISALSACKKDSQVSSIKIDKTTLTLKIGERHQFKITKGEKIFRVEEFDWYSSDNNIGVVNGSGQFQSAKEGVVTVRAEYDGDKSIVVKCLITVIK